MERANLDYSILIYDDGSEDNTIEQVRSCMDGTPLELIEGKSNKGLAVAMRNLIERVMESDAHPDDIIIVLDADETHNPGHIMKMVDRIHDGFDVVVASRFRADSRVVGVPAYRQLLSVGASILMKILFPIKGIKDYTCGYRAYRVEILGRAKEKFGDRLFEGEGFSCMAELLIKLRSLNLLAVEVPLVLRYDKKLSKSKLPLLRTIVSTLKILIQLRFRRFDAQSNADFR
jgi:dolichol-phosphate mannosyltransferase